jgi:serine protease Do
MASFEPQDYYDPDAPPPRPTTEPVRWRFLVVLLILLMAAGLVYGIPYIAARTGYAWEAGRARAATEALDRLDRAGLVGRSSELFRMATVAVSPAVVNVQTIVQRRGGMIGFPLGGGRFGPAFEGKSVGSGFVIDKQNGFIVTNNHVVRGADQIIVRLSEGTEVPARLIGADPKTDLAVLQVKADVKVAAQWGDSDKLDIGDWVLAIGSPFMLDRTVTAGIISASGRNNLPLPNSDEGSYQDFLQTDAAINPGNSGGPLVDLSGKVIGINTAIFTTQHGGFEGIGLAIPSALARPIVESIIKNGRAVHGYLGVMIQPLTPALAEQFKVPSTRGSLVAQVQPDSPAAQAGLQVGDIIVQLGDKDVPDPTSLRNQIARQEIGAKVPLSLYRAGKLQTVTATIDEQPLAPEAEPMGFRLFQLPPGRGGNPLGTLVIDQVIAGSPAARAGLRPGMQVVAVGKTPVHTMAEYDAAIARYSLEDGIPLEIEAPNGESASVIVGGPPQDQR